MPLERVREAIAAIKKGEMIIIMDDEDRENEGDLVFGAEFSSPQKINFMAQEARGLICVSITKKLADQLDLKPMVEHNNSNHETAFTVSIDAKEATTGISAFERDLTIRLMCDPNANASHFVKPGHIFPLIAKEGGVLVRTGHTEASLDICHLAGLKRVAVICEIMKKDGSMARRGDKFLIDFAKEHNLKILYVSDLISYRLQFEQLITQGESVPCCFFGYECERITFTDHLLREHIAFVFGETQSDSLFKFYNTHDTLNLLADKQKFEHLTQSIRLIKDRKGALIFLGSSSYDQSHMRSIGIGAQIIRMLGVRDFNLITSNEDIEFVGLSGFGLNIKQKITL